jgi:hypothetical protein
MTELKQGLPKREGIYQIDVEPQDSPYLAAIKISKAATLAELAKEYALFSHAALFVYGNWIRDPIQDYIIHEDPDCKPFWIDFDSPIFSGMFFRTRGGKTNRDWAYRLMACPLDSWGGLMSFLQQLQGFNEAEKRYHKTILQKVPMTDYFALRKKAVLPSPIPKVDVFLVALDGNDRVVHFEPAKNPPIDHIKVRFSPPEPDTIKLGEEILKRNARPLMLPVLDAANDGKASVKEEIAINSEDLRV